MGKACIQKKSCLKRILIFFLSIGIIGFFIYSYTYMEKEIPNNIKLTLNKDEEFHFDLPIECELQSSQGVININNESIPSSEIKLNLREPFTLKATEFGNYKINLKLFGFLDFKEIKVEVIEDIELIPAGDAIGIYMETDGVMVLGTGLIKGEDGYN